MEDITILSPPLDVPQPKYAPSTSESLWFVEMPQDATVVQGRTLRLQCQVNSKKPMGKIKNMARVKLFQVSINFYIVRYL